MALTLSGTNGVVGAGFTLDASGASVTAGVGTFGSLNAPAAGLTGALPALNAASLTQIPAANLVGVCTAGLGNASGAFGQGKILQVVHAIKSSGFSVSASTDNFSDITGLSASITPVSSSNKILIHFQSSFSTTSIGQRGSFRLLRDSTVVNAANADGQSTNQTIFPGLVIRDNTSMSVPVAGSFFDNPSTTSEVTYKLQVGAEGGAGTIFVNADASGNTGSTNYKGVSNLILMEVSI